MPQTVSVRYYAQLREALKTPAEDVDLTPPFSERGILAQLAERHPRQRALFLASRVAVAEAYADPDAPLAGLESGVDIISPISGG